MFYYPRSSRMGNNNVQYYNNVRINDLNQYSEYPMYTYQEDYTNISEQPFLQLRSANTPRRQPQNNAPLNPINQPTTGMPTRPNNQPGTGMPTVPNNQPGTGMPTGHNNQPGTGMPTGPNNQPGTGIPTGPNNQPGTGIPTGPNNQPGTEMPTGPNTGVNGTPMVPEDDMNRMPMMPDHRMNCMPMLPNNDMNGMPMEDIIRFDADRFSESLAMIRKSVEGEREDELFYDDLIALAPDQEQKGIIESIRNDERKHNQYFRNIYRDFTGEEIQALPNPDYQKPQSYIKGIEKALLGELSAVERYRKIRVDMPNQYYRDILFEIITDELKHASKYNYLYSMNHH